MVCASFLLLLAQRSRALLCIPFVKKNVTFVSNDYVAIIKDIKIPK